MSRSLLRSARQSLLFLVASLIMGCAPNPGAKDDYPRPATPLPTVSAHNAFVMLSWPKVNDAIEYRIYKSTTRGGTRAMADTNLVKTELSYEDKDVSNGQTYYYAVTAYGLGGESEKSDELAGTPQAPPGAPVNVRATLANGVATVVWDEVSNTGSYNVYMASEAGVIKQETTRTAFARGGLDETKTYYFTITAINLVGEEGAGSVVASTAPVTVAMAAGANHSCAIRPDRTLVCWGANDSGQLGLGNKIPSFSPVEVEGRNWRHVTAGGNHTCAINTDGELFCWGQNTYGQLGNSDPSGKTIPAQIGIDRNWQNVSAGIDHTCAVKTNHTLWCWGSNQYGQPALGEIDRLNEPKHIYPERTWNTVSAGNHHTCAVQQSGALECWGENVFGQLGGSGNETPVPAGTGLLWTSVAVGGEHSCGLKSDTSLWCWGHNKFGQVGNGTSDKESHSFPQLVGKGRWTSVQLGQKHSCAMRIDGPLSCWGANFKRQISERNITISNVPAEVPSAPNWRTAALGDAHTCALAEDGTFKCWGNNENGQLGKGSPVNRPLPSPVRAGRDWRSVTAGWYHTCAIKMDDSLWCWGGSGTQGVLPKLAGAGKPSDPGWLSVVIAHFRACAIRGDETLWCTSMNYGGIPRFGGQQFGRGDDRWKQVVITKNNTCALRTDRTIWCWGTTYDSQVPAIDTESVWEAIALNSDEVLCAIKTADGSRWCQQNGAPGIVLMDNAANLKTLTADGKCGIKSDGTMKCIVPSNFPTRDTWMKVSSNNAAGVCAIRNDRSLWCGGYRIGTDLDNEWDDISVNDNSTYDLPGAIPDTYYCGVRSDHTLWCWGNTRYGQLGNAKVSNSTIPVSVKNESTWNAVAAGGEHTCAIANNDESSANRRLHCWGKNNYGQLGIGSRQQMSKPEPVDSGSQWLSITTGNSHTCGIKITGEAAAGTLWCWGANGYGQLGADRNEETHILPYRVTADPEWILVAAGDHHTCALKSGGTLWCWGFNAYGQIGDGDTQNVFIPKQIELNEASNWKTVTAGENHTCAITGEDTLYCWGENYNGQLGIGDTRNRLTPTAINADASILWTAVATGSQHTCALRTGGDLWCWGDHQFGQLAYGNDQNSRRLLPEKSLSLVSKVAAGGRHTCVTYLYQTYPEKYGVYCSGANGSGQLGDASTISKSSPVPSNIGPAVSLPQPGEIAITAGSRHTCALRENGTMLCWGDNSDGQIGRPE